MAVERFKNDKKKKLYHTGIAAELSVWLHTSTFKSQLFTDSTPHSARAATRLARMFVSVLCENVPRIPSLETWLK